LGAITKPMPTKKVSEPTFLHQFKRCCGILFGLSAQIIMAFIFDINTTNENYKEMSYLTDLRSHVDITELQKGGASHTPPPT
jgi:hypothetical protein